MCAPACGGAMYFRRKTSAGRAYLQIVESRRSGDQVRQQVIATLGRFEDLQASGQLERLLRSLQRQLARGDNALVRNKAEPRRPKRKASPKRGRRRGHAQQLTGKNDPVQRGAKTRL